MGNLRRSLIENGLVVDDVGDTWYEDARIPVRVEDTALVPQGARIETNEDALALRPVQRGEVYLPERWVPAWAPILRASRHILETRIRAAADAMRVHPEIGEALVTLQNLSGIDPAVDFVATNGAARAAVPLDKLTASARRRTP